jgi:hypothetical protein
LGTASALRPAVSTRSCASAGTRATTSRASLTPISALAIAVQKHHIEGLYLSRVPGISVLILPLIRLEFAFEIDLRTLAQVLLTDLSEAVPGHHVVPLGLLDFIAVLIGVGFVCGEGHITDGRATVRVSKLRLVSEIANEDDFVDATGHGTGGFGNVLRKKGAVPRVNWVLG